MVPHSGWGKQDTAHGGVRSAARVAVLLLNDDPDDVRGAHRVLVPGDGVTVCGGAGAEARGRGRSAGLGDVDMSFCPSVCFYA